MVLENGQKQAEIKGTYLERGTILGETHTYMAFSKNTSRTHSTEQTNLNQKAQVSLTLNSRTAMKV